jgi:hypothetical protein
MAGWDKTVPTSGSKITSTPSIFQNNWAAMDSILGWEHYGMTSSLSGRHYAGYVGAMHVSGNAEIAALTSPSTGALAWVHQTGSGVGLIRGQSAWKVVDYDLATSRVIQNTSSLNQTVLSGVTTCPTLWALSNPATLDSLTEYGKYGFTPSAAGYFMMALTIMASSTTSGGDSFTMGFSATGISHVTTLTTTPSALQTYSYSTIVSASSGVTVLPYIHTSQNTFVSGAAGNSFLSVWRIS